MSTHARDSRDASRWLARGRQQLADAERLSDRIESASTVCFLAQQSAELFIKAALVRRGESPPRTHDLALLAKIVGAPELSGLTAELNSLVRWVTISRYPPDEDVAHHVDPSLDDALIALTCARRILKTVEALIS